MAAALNVTDFLPRRFDGSVVDSNTSTAHFLCFYDYLEAHLLHDPENIDEVEAVVARFKRTLCGEARLWIEGKRFDNLQQLKDKFITRFSERKSHFAHYSAFNDISFNDDKSVECHLQHIRQAADAINYGEEQVRDKFLSTIPARCRAAVIMATTPDTTNDELAHKAQQFLDLDKGGNPNKEVAFINQDAQSEIHALREEIKSLKLQNSVQRGRSPHRESGRGRFDSSRSQSRDKRSGSRRRSASRASQNRNQSHRKIICDYCLIPGHAWRVCRKRQRDLQRKQNQRQRDF